MDPENYTFAPWQGDQTLLVATGSVATSALAAGLAGLLAAGRAEIGETDGTDATTALAIRAEGANVADLFAGLAAALFDQIDHEEYDVRAVRFDGMVRTDRGLAGWGYALAVPGEGRIHPLSVEGVEITDQEGATVLRATVRRASA